LNLRAQPTAEIQVGASVLAVTATEVTREGYELLWRRYIAAYRGFAGHREKPKRATFPFSSSGLFGIHEVLSFTLVTTTLVVESIGSIILAVTVALVLRSNRAP